MANTDEFPIVTIDGGAATGKSSTSRGLAERLGFMHVDTGAHYRTITHALLRAGADPNQPAVLADTLGRLTLATHLDGRTARLSINGGVPADADIRSPAVNAAVAQVATVEAVRSFLFDYQRSQVGVAKEHGFGGLIMEGRDIGSVIFPTAPFRFFLFADEATRAARRAKEGQTDSITARDKIDSSRKTAPLICPEGAIQINTGPHTLEEVIGQIARYIAA